jgi:hypothetical protein
MRGEENALPAMDAGILCAYRQRLDQKRPDPVSLPIINDRHGNFGEIGRTGVAEAPSYANEIDFTLRFVQYGENQRKMP